MENKQKTEVELPVAEASCCTPSCCSGSAEAEAEPQDLKSIVREKYGAIAERTDAAGCCDTLDGTYSIMADEYDELAGYAPTADLKLGCGLPTEFAQIKPGDTVVDLGSGAGNDCFVARAETGETGRVIGVDFTTAMIRKARANVLKLGYNNVSFVQGDIEDIPLPADIADVVVSNCVFNLVPNKQQAFQEAHRILKPGAHFSISDIVLEGDLPTELQKDAELYAGCVAGAIQMNDYLQLLTDQGFKNLNIQKKKAIKLPKEVLAKHLTDTQIEAFNDSFGIYSITVYGEK
ncbi:MAG: arsenite methyltransferase [Bacteroidota bacterium]